MKYEQLTIEKRYQIYVYSKANGSQKDIAAELKVHRITIYREMKRNKGQRGYRPQQATLMAKERKKNAKKRIKMTHYLKFIVAQKIRDDWSPEQISGNFKKHLLLDISHQTIIDKNQKGVIVAMVERKSKFIVAYPVPNKSETVVTNAMVNMKK